MITIYRVLSVCFSDFICSQILWKKMHATKLLQSNSVVISRVAPYLCNFSFTDYTHVRHRKTEKKRLLYAYGINISNIWNPSSRLSRVILPKFSTLLFSSPRVTVLANFSRLISPPLKYVHDDPYDISFELRAQTYSTGTTLFLTSRSLLAYIKRTMYKKLNMPIASLSSGYEAFRTRSHPDVFGRVKRVVIRFSLERKDRGVLKA